jgi:hypothetical protein
MILNADPNQGGAIQINGNTYYTGAETSNSPQAASSGGSKLTFLGWGVLLLGLYAFNGTSTGHEMIYYSMVLIVLFLFVFNYKQILAVLTKK